MHVVSAAALSSLGEHSQASVREWRAVADLPALTALLRERFARARVFAAAAEIGDERPGCWPLRALAAAYRHSPRENLARVVCTLRRGGANRPHPPTRHADRQLLDERRFEDPEGVLSFHIRDRPALDHALVFARGELAIAPCREGAFAIETRWSSYVDYMLGSVSAQLQFLDGEWSFSLGRTSFFDYRAVEPQLRALDRRLPSPCPDLSPYKRRVIEAARRLGPIKCIERIAQPTAAQFLARFGRLGRPCIATDSTATWPKPRWSFADLAQAYGDHLTHLSDYPPEVVPIREYIEAVVRGDSLRVKLALPLVRSLRESYRQPSFAGHGPFFERAQALLIAPADASAAPDYAATCWHRDWADNYLVQLIGSKRIYLAPPTDEHCFYLQSVPARSGNVAVDFSPLRGKSVDLAKYPAFRRARVIECVLEPGDTLYLPCGWFHHVENLSPSCGINCWKLDPPSELPG